jgi:hypothetical protein
MSHGGTMTNKIVKLKTLGMVFHIRLRGGMTPREYELRFLAEQVELRRHYCNAFNRWRHCRCKPCIRARRCTGDALACLKRAVPEVPRNVQFAARQRLLESTPANIGAPERYARGYMPEGLCG